jgi:hypothetical protein
MAAVLCGWGPALAQVERRELPALPGEAPPAETVPAVPAAPAGEWSPDVPLPPEEGYQPAEEWQPDIPLPAPSHQPLEEAWRPDVPLPQAAAGAPGESAIPPDVWRGLDGVDLQRLLKQVPMPSSSPALTSLLARALGTSPEGDSGARIAALERAGRVNELIEMLGQTNEPDGLAAYAVALLAAGRSEEACALQLDPGAAAKRAAYLVPAYCAALSGDRDAARQALSVARDNGVDAGFASRSVEGQRAVVPQRVDVLDYLFLKLGQAGARADLAGKATPELLFLLARDDEAAAELRLAAAERAASLNVIDGETLAAVYADAAPKLPKAAQSPSALRAKLFAALQSQTSEKIRAESVDALLASGKDARIEIPMAQAMAKTSGFAEDTQAADFTETGVRVAALAGDDGTAWELTESAGDRVRSWQLLLVATDPLSDRARTALESGVDIALKAGLPGPLLQRLVTALDALGEEVPIPLWDLAAKNPQPDDGYLPPTGMLSALKEAADKGDTGATILLAAAAFGPDGPQGAHLIALGDGLRALKRVGLDAEARRLAFEALYAHWPARGRA